MEDLKSMKRITAIIPTMLKNKELLSNLINSLDSDSSVEEIIIINNSQETFDYKTPKVKVISKGKNLYVNPGWNLGVSEAKSKYITLVNDDIIIPANFCSSVLEKFDDKFGIIGIDDNYVNNIRENDFQITNKYEGNCKSDIKITPVSYRTKNFGIMMFFNKKIYTPIPEKLKVFFGDDYIIHFAKKQKKINAVISGKEIFHFGSLTSRAFTEFANHENIIYKKYVLPWYKRMLYFYERDTHYIFYILFVQFAIKKI